MNHFLDFTTTANAAAYLSQLNDHSLVIYSPTSLKLMDVTQSKSLLIDTHAIGRDATKIEEFCANRNIDVVVGVGGGAAIDIAKYAASLIGCRYVCIPTLLSTNAFATNKVALMRNGLKLTLDAKLADEIILDPDLVSNAGIINLYGLCDILSIHTALYDWSLADKKGVESIKPDIYKASRKLLDDAIELSTSLSTSALDIPTLFALIGESGHITNIYGSGRPESGSEHIFAKELERRVDVPHGISIAAGITIMSQLQSNYSADVQEALQRTGVMSDIAESYDLHAEIELSLASLLPRKDRYTILDEKSITANDSKRLTDRLYAEILGPANEYSYR